jgi:hypothetical protein
MFLVLAVAFLAAGSVPRARTDDSSGDGSGNRIRNHILAHQLDIEAGRAVRLKYEQQISSGLMNALKEATWEMERPDAADADANALANGQGDANDPSSGGPPSFRRTQGCQNVFYGHGVRNVRVNQDCSRRRQAEEAIAINPTAPHNLIVGYNDSRIGFNHGAYAWSFDRGNTWGDQVPPFFGFVMKDGHTADAFSDPTATFDADGNAYIGGVFFDVNFAASALLVVKSNAGIGGAFYHSPVPGTFQTYNVNPGVIASDNDPNVAHDKEFIVADASASSPKKNNVYMTWTRFANTGVGVGGNSPIYFSQSINGGAAWSKGVEISGANAVICALFQGEATPGACDQDQGSHPIVGPDGTIYVAFGNGNTPFLGVNQHLIVSCPPGKDCSNAASWTAPVKIADDIGTQPIGPNAATGCPFGRQCLPPNGYRMDDFVEGSISVDSSGKLYAVWADFRNGGGSCSWSGGTLGSAVTATPPCNNDVFYAYSTDGGATWSPTINVTPASKFGQTAQWMPWSAVAPDGSKLWIGFYDRHYGNCETTGCNDITLAKVRKPATASPKVAYSRVTTSSMPNLVPANNPAQAGFLGDYMWVATDADGHPHVVWADTRGLNGIVEEDVYYAKFGDEDDHDH